MQQLLLLLYVPSRLESITLLRVYNTYWGGVAVGSLLRTPKQHKSHSTSLLEGSFVIM